jgi:hypothetical protein
MRGSRTRPASVAADQVKARIAELEEALQEPDERARALVPDAEARASAAQAAAARAEGVVVGNTAARPTSAMMLNQSTPIRWYAVDQRPRRDFERLAAIPRTPPRDDHHDKPGGRQPVIRQSSSRIGARVVTPRSREQTREHGKLFKDMTLPPGLDSVLQIP